MAVRRRIARLNRVGLNRLTRHLAPWLPGFGVVVHRGRRSGREYRTPVNVFGCDGTIRIALTYGADSDWVKNVLAAGGGRLLTRGRALELYAPKLAHDPSRTCIRPGQRAILRILGVRDFLDLSERPAVSGRQ